TQGLRPGLIYYWRCFAAGGHMRIRRIWLALATPVVISNALWAQNAPTRPGFRAAPPIFQRYCGSCHSKDIAALQEYSPERIYDALTVEKMKVEAAEIPDVQKRQIAEFLSARLIGSDEAGDVKKMTNPCPANPPMADPAAGPAWNGWGNSEQNARFQNATNAGL